MDVHINTTDQSSYKNVKYACFWRHINMACQVFGICELIKDKLTYIYVYCISILKEVLRVIARNGISSKYISLL